MNNLQWYKEVLQFCQLSKNCKNCPYNLLTKAVTQDDPTSLPCFSTKEALLSLETWLRESVTDNTEGQNDCEFNNDDHQWLKDLLKGQFPDEIEDELCIEDDFL